MFKKITFKNGLRSVLFPMKNTKSVTVLVLVGAGSKFEEKKENGTAHFLEHMCFKGTKKRPRTFDISKEIDAVGGIINAFTSKDYTSYYVKVDSSHLELAIDIVSDIFLHPLLQEQELEKERGVIIEEIKMIEDNPMSYIEDLWERLLYGDQPAGWDIAGDIKTVSKIQKSNLMNFINNHYLAKNVVIGVAGNIQTKKTISLIKSYFSDIKKGKIKKKKKVKDYNPPFLQKHPKKLFYKKAIQQTHLALGVRSFNLFHKDRFSLDVLSVILGGNMSSRLFQKLRERRGLAYYVSTQAEMNPDTGYLATFTGIDNKNIDKVVSLILEEYKNLTLKELEVKEVERAKKYLLGRMLLSLEESHSIASFYAFQELLRKEILTPSEKIKMIKKVNPFTIREMAEKIFKGNRLNLAVISPKKYQVKSYKLI